MVPLKCLKFRQVILIGLLYFIYIGVVANEQELYNLNLQEPWNSERKESGRLKNVDSKNPELVVEGSYSIKNLETGQKFYNSIVMYVADKNGYRVRYELRPSNFTGLGLSGATLKIAAG